MLTKSMVIVLKNRTNFLENCVYNAASTNSIFSLKTVGCLYCGKEIGPLQLLRDEEFCSVAHRKRYGERLGRALHKILDSEPIPSSHADFHLIWPFYEGNSQPFKSFVFEHSGLEISLKKEDLPIDIRPVLGSEPVGLPLHAEAPPAAATQEPRPSDPFEISAANPVPPALPLLQPVMQALTPLNPAAYAGPPTDAISHSNALTPSIPLEPQPVESLLHRSEATAPIAAAIPIRRPQFPNIAIEPATIWHKPEQSQSPLPASHPVALPALCGPDAAAYIPASASICLPQLPNGVIKRAAAKKSHTSIGSSLPTPQPTGLTSLSGPEPALPEMRAMAAVGRAEWPIPTASQPRFALRALGEMFGAAVSDETKPFRAPQTLCGICVPPGPPAEPATRPVALHSRPTWEWPVPALAAPALPMADVIRPVLRAFESFAVVPPADPVEALMVASEACTLAATKPAIVLPSGLERLAQTAIPLSRAAASLEARPDALHGSANSVTGAVSGGSGSTGPRISGIWSAGAAASVATPAPCESAAFRPAAVPVESLPETKPTIEAVPPAFTLCYPAFSLGELTLAATVPEAGQSRPQVARIAATAPSVPLQLVAAAGGLATPLHNLDANVATTVPQVGVVPIEFFCSRASAQPFRNLNCIRPAPPLALPHFTLSAAVEPLEQRVAPAPPRPKQKRNPVAEVFRLPGAHRRRRRMPDLVGPIAACFIIGAFLWLGAKTMHVAGNMPVLNRDVATVMSHRSGGSTASASARTPRSSEGGSAPAAAPPQSGFLAGVHRAIVSRAASQINESFHEGMMAWGDGRATPSGWTRSPDGYIRPAAFAIFRPSLNFRDYRVEFLGQIEQKSVSWAVRASDADNYLAMKVRVIEPGARPVVAIEHYPVIAGHRGRRTETPLPNLMFHNNTPYHVEIAVKGNRVITSIEGQEVDSWTDDMPSKGGVGLFADAGERSRIYWMKVSRNEDLLGRICAYITGNDGETSVTTGDLAPHGSPASPGWPSQNTEFALASAFVHRGFERRRIRSWKS